MAGGFAVNTRLKRVKLPTFTKPTGGGTQIQTLPKTGMLARLWLAIRGTVAGTLSAPNALGMASILPRVRLGINSGIDVFALSASGYHYGLRETLESEYIDPNGQANARSAVTATTFNLDMVIPVALNLRDPIGLIMLQNEATLATLEVTWEADGSVATGATVTGTIVPYMDIFTVPADPQDWPPLDVIHQILEDTQAVGASGDYTYYWPRGNTYLQILHMLGIGASGADGFTQYDLRLNQSDHLLLENVDMLDMEQRYFRGRARPAGLIPIDFLGTSGLGNYGLTRDLVNSALITDVASVITATGAGTLRTVRRQLVILR